MEESQSISNGRLKTFHDKVYYEADDTIHKFVIGYFILGVLFSFFHQTWWIGLGAGGFFFIAYFIIKSYWQHKPFYRYFVSFLFWNYPLQFIIQTHGMYEIHFFYFVSLTVLLFYEDWRIIMPAAIYAMFSICILYYCQVREISLPYLGEGHLLTNSSFIMHLSLLIVYSGLCVLWSKVQRNQTKDSAISQVEMEERLSHMEANIQFADAISQGNLHADYLLPDTDNLGQSLMNMRNSLTEAAERESKEKFINVGLASIAEILRNNVNNLDNLCNNVIAELVGYMKSNQGAIFIEEELEEGEKVLELKAAVAYERKKYLEKRVMIGQGLVGQAYLEQDPILLTDIPENYVAITSGLGKATPRCLLVIPLKSNEEVVGVIEMASFQKFNELDVEFMQRVGESIASTVLSAKINQKTASLLEDAETMTEQMQAQEEEMRQNLEELQATQEEMARTQNELKTKESNIRSLIDNTEDTIFAINTKYVITVVNSTLRNKYLKMGLDLAPGTNILDILPADKAAHWKARYDRALKGESYVEVDKNVIAGKTTYSETHHNAIKNEFGKVIGVSVTSRDVTETRKIHDELREKEISLNALVNNTNDSIIAIDKNYKVMIVNDSIKNRYKGTQYEGLDVGTNALDMLGNVREEWKGYYDRALNGEKLNFIIKSSVKGENTYREYFIYPMRSSIGDITGCSVFSREVLDHIDKSKLLSKL